MTFDPNSEIGKRALAALQTARPLQYHALKLRMEGLTQEAIAEQLGIAQSSVSSRLAGAERSLARLSARIQALANKHL